MIMRKTGVRLVSAALAACMMASVLPMGAMAQGGGEETENGVSAQDISAVQSGDIEINEENFPDPIFRKFVERYENFPRDNKLSQSELAAVTRIDCSPSYGATDDEKIKSLKGIEYFTSLEYLRCIDNLLTELDLSSNTALKGLDCYNNQLKKLDVSNNTALKRLDCYRNQLKKLDVSNHTELKTLMCWLNQLTELDVSNSTELEYLDFSSNQLTKLDVSQNAALKYLDCGYNQLKKLDVSKNPALETLECGGNQLTELDVSNNTALERLRCDDNQLTKLDVGSKPALKVLLCDDNQLTELDVSNSPALEWLWFSDNQLMALDVRDNTALEKLNCDDNQLTELDLSKNTALEGFHCERNHLTSLDVSNTKIYSGYYGHRSYWDGNSYTIAVDPKNNQFDLQNLPGNFDVSKARNWKGGTVKGNTLTAKADKVTYNYDGGRGQIFDFTLNIQNLPHSHTYGDWSHNDTDHWHECTDTDCPDKTGSVKDKAKHIYDDDADTTCNECGYVRTLTPTDPDAPADGGAADDAADNIKGALSAIVVGAVAGAIIYETGTGIYRVINMPGIAMPSNRGELAMLLWEHAGKPEPVSTALYSDITEDDIDLNKAARWAVEQDLMQDNSEKNTFNPRFPVSKLRTCLTWNAAKEKGLFDTDKTAE